MDALARQDPRVRFVEQPGPFNYSRLNNAAVEAVSGEHVILMNNDVTIITPDWIEALLEHSQREDVGAVGGKLYYPDGRIQHAGIVIGIHGFAGHIYRRMRGTLNGDMNRLQTVRNVSAVTGALMMVKTALYRDCGGLEEEHLGTALNDVDFCLRLRERGLLNVFTPCCEATHHESASRDYERTPEQRARLDRECAWFKKRHREILADGDPYHSPGLTYASEDVSCARALHGEEYGVSER